MRYFEHFRNAVGVLHSRYGKSDIVEIRHFADGRLEIESKRPGFWNHVARGTVETLPSGAQRVRLYRRQITFQLVK